MSIQISAIICTCNRAAYLKKAIQSLVDQTLPKEQYEIIIVDNGSTDNTKAVVESFGKQGNIRYIFEPRVGLSIARNTGIEEASGEIVAFMDDDAMADENWLEEIIKTFNWVKPSPGACGGKVKLLWEAPCPKWLGDELLRFLGEFDYGDEAFFVETPDKFLGGMNMAFRKDAFKVIGLFYTQLGRIGKKLLSGEEIELFHRMLKKDLKIFYNPKIVVTHHVPKDRLKKRFHYQRFYYEGRSSAVLDFGLNNQRRTYCVKKLIQGTYNLVRLSAGGILPKFGILGGESEEKMVTRRCLLNLYGGYCYQQSINFMKGYQSP